MRKLCWLASLALVPSVGIVRAEEPQIEYQVRLLRVSATVYERLNETVPLDGKKTLACSAEGFQTLLEAVQADPESSILCSPRVLAISGHQAVVQIGQQQRFITGTKVTTKNGRVCCEPDITEITTGLELRLTGKIRGRDQGIETNLQVTGSRIEGVELVPIQVTAGTESKTQTQFIQKPEVVRNSLERTLTLVPGRTVVLPAWWETGEKPDVELPVLGKVPLLNGFFVTVPKESQRVIVCVTARPVR